MRDKERKGLSAECGHKYRVGNTGKQKRACWGQGRSWRVAMDDRIRKNPKEFRRKEATWGSGVAGTTIPTACKRKAFLECLKSFRACMGRGTGGIRG